MKIAIAIPARYGSTRFPGKPLAEIGGQSMLSRVVDVAKTAIGNQAIDVFVTTEDQRIADHAKEIGVTCIITSDDCRTGSDRVLQAAKKSGKHYDFIINFQGDAPFTNPVVISELIKIIQERGNVLEVVTPVHQLSWDDLDKLREAKKTTPFSGTTVLRYQNGEKAGYAFAFSKQIIPAIRKEDRTAEKSPVYQHVGIYGYRMDILEKFVKLPEGAYEKLEGLEQMRLLENGISIFTVKVIAPSGSVSSGIDSPEDLARAEKLLQAAS